MEKKITIEKTVRYSTYGDPETAENIWIVLHGYGQLTEFFIRKFRTLNFKENYVVAPEGFHRFYIEGTSGRVGASWMTKENRLDDIQDNHNYLNQLADLLLKKKKYQRKFLLGFSQGGATASRWHQSGNFKADNFILWGSVFAEDIPFENKQNGIFESNNYFVVGSEDPYFKGKTDGIMALFKEQEFPIKIKMFDGVHDIDSNTLLEILEECENNVLGV